MELMMMFRVGDKVTFNESYPHQVHRWHRELKALGGVVTRTSGSQQTYAQVGPYEYIYQNNALRLKGDFSIIDGKE
jgi:hypothetical protein